MSSYTYQPIDPWANTIRLLRLFQGRRHYSDGRVCGELFEAQLPDERDDTYEALSYTWGDPTRTKTITINGQEVAVTTNLYDALFHLRDPEKDRILWVDALCINQQDAFERTHQVAKMSVIYQKAWAVVIWLGKTTRDIELLLEATKALDKIVRQRPRPSNNAEYLKVWIDEGRQFISEKRSINPDFFEIRQRALKELLRRSWFRRVWVVQEAAYAKTAYIQCSWISVPTRVFCIMPYLLEIQTYMDARSEALLEVLPGPLRQSSWWNDTRDLSTVLQKFSSCESTDPRDQIFALLGLSCDCTKDGRVFLPNYELSTLECIQQTVFFLAFGEILIPDMFSLPAWDLEEFRYKLPSLRLALLEWAIEQDKSGIHVVEKLLLEAPCFNVNQRIFLDQLPLPYLISAQKSMDIIRIYLDHDNLDIHQANTALKLAAEQGLVDIVHILLGRKDAEILHSPREIQSALECAIGFNRYDSFTTIYHASFDFKRGMSHCNKISLLHYAAERGSIFAITELIQDGVHADATHNPKDETPLAIATGKGLLAAVKLLAQSGADVNREDILGDSPLVRAAKRGDLDMLHALMELGARIPRKTIPHCIYLWTNHSSIQLERMLETLELLIDRAGYMNAEADHVLSVSLFRAISGGSVALVRLLLRCFPNTKPDSKDCEGDTALIFAAATGQVSIARLLVIAGASLVEEGRFGLNALWTAVAFGHVEVVELLDQHGADIHISEAIASRLPDILFGDVDELRVRGAQFEAVRQYLQVRGVDFSVRETTRSKKNKASYLACND